MKKVYWLIGVGTIMVTLAAVLAGFDAPRNPQLEAAELAPADSGHSDSTLPELPDLTLATLEGDKVSLADLAGRPLIINFWATWCPPCRSEMPALVELYYRHADQGLVVIAVNAGETTGLVQGYADELELNFPVVLDPKMKAAAAFSVVSLPTTFFVGRDGLIQERHAGELTPDQFESKVAPLLIGE
jgi:thiol-disulfide isomerase/thioredoxin